MPEGPAPTLTDYTSTRWYRARETPFLDSCCGTTLTPRDSQAEVLLGSVHYGKGVDLWAAGCVLGELFLHRPLFPGRTTMHQVHSAYRARHLRFVIYCPFP